MSANKPCRGGRIAPPNIIIISMDDASAVLSPSLSIARVNTFDHIIELKRPIAKSAQIDQEAKLPKTFIPTNNKALFTTANMASERAGLDFPR